MIALLNLIPRWLLLAAIVALAALSAKLSFDAGSARSDLAEVRVEKADLETAVAQANARAQTQATEFSNKVIKAQNDAKERETTLRSAAVAAAFESDGLRDDLATLRVQLDQTTRAAAIERALALGVVLQQCSKEYQGLAAIADRHASDVQTLIQAWPK